ncbi:MAG: GNAT family N-acetyltransferase [Exilispira sp.]
MIDVKLVNCEYDRKRFVKFQFDLYKKNKFWVPPFFKDEVNSLNPAKNKAFNFSDAQFFLFEKNKKIVGRIGLIITKNSEKEKEFAKISRFECIEDYDVAKFIFDFAKSWAKEREKIYLHGPLGFTNFDTQGLLIEGFNKIPTTASVYNFEYYKDFFEKYGFKKEIDWVEYEIKVPDKIPEKALKIAEIVTQRYNIKVINFKCKKDLLNYAKAVFDLINITYKDLFSSVQLNDELIEHYINSYIKKIEPQLVKVAVDKNDNVIGFVISMPSLSLAMQKAKGRLFPFGFLYLLNAIKKYDKLDLYLGAVHPDYQGKGITALLMVEMTRTAIDKRIKTVETNSELENNIKVQRNWDYFNTTLIKRKRSFIIKV